MMTLSKAELVDALSQELALTRAQAREFVDVFFEMLRQRLSEGHCIKLSGFGKFVLRDKPERPGRNPKTGELAPVHARRVVTFKPSVRLKE